MKTDHFTHKLKELILPSLVILLLIGGAVYLSEYRYRQLSSELSRQAIENASTTRAVWNDVRDVNERLIRLAGENNALGNRLLSQQEQSQAVQEQIGKIYDTADTLSKLSKTDPQLLQKYSKVYFLNEHYVPSKLVTIDSKYTFNNSRSYQFHATVYPHLEKMIKDALAENVKILVISSYRSFGTQAALKSSYRVIYGAGTANQFSADQGYSEHQLGTTLDFTTPEVGDSFTGFEKTIAYTWLINNAYKYGFILSYPPNNSYYEYEPWHWRYVGIDLATRLHREGKYFYDLDQRILNDYLPLFFD